MDLLLDTHALLWWRDGDPDLSAPAGRAIEDTSNAARFDRFGVQRLW